MIVRKLFYIHEKQEENEEKYRLCTTEQISDAESTALPALFMEIAWYSQNYN